MFGFQQQVMMDSGPVIQNLTVDIFTSGTEYSDSGSLPVKPSIGNQYWRYSATHMLVRASEINADVSGAKIITGVQARIASSLGLTQDPDYSAKNIGIFLAHTDETVMNGSVKTDMSQSSVVFDYSDRIRVKNKGNLSLLDAGYRTIDFDTDFIYDGTSNLVFSFYNEGSTTYQSGRRTATVYGDVGTIRTATYGSDSASNPATNGYNMSLMDSGDDYYTIDLKINY